MLLLPQPCKDVIKGSGPCSIDPSVVVIPAGCDDDQAKREEDGNHAHFENQVNGHDDSRDLHPRIERRFVAGIVRLDTAFAHHDHCDAHQCEHQQLESAGQLGNPHRIEEQQNQDDGSNRQQDGIERRAEFTDLPETPRQQVIAAHGQGIARRAQQPGIGNRDESEECRNRNENHPERPHGIPGGGRHRRQAPLELFGRNQGDNQQCADKVNQDRRSQGQHHPLGQVLLRVFNFL